MNYNEYKTYILPDDLLHHWINIAPGAFSAADLTPSIDGQQLYIDKLEGFVEAGILDHHGTRRGWYIPRKTELVEMDYINAIDEPIDIWLPFGLSDLVELYENSVVIIAGAPNSGKTAVLLNVIKENRLKDWDIHYFNSEMSAGELKKRLSLFPDVALENWHFKAYHRADRFHDVVVPHPNAINIIDFLEVHDEFYMVGKRIKEIHDALKGGIAIIALQKNPGCDVGLGGYRSMEVTRLAISMDYGKVKVTKAKNFRKGDTNPNGFMKDFKLVNGCQIIDRHGWYRERDCEI